MLNKALLASPKEFKISIGTQTYCSVQLSKTSAMPGEKITVTVNPATGYGNTTVGISTNGSVTKVNNTTFTFIMPFTDVVVNASASILSFSINVNKQGSGNVNVKSVANYGETVTVTVSPTENWYLKSISASVSLSGSGNSRTFKMPANDVTINISFDEIIIILNPGVYDFGDGEFYAGLDPSYKIGSISPVPYFYNDRNIKLNSMFVVSRIIDREYNIWEHKKIVYTSNDHIYIKAQLVYPDGSTGTWTASPDSSEKFNNLFTSGPIKIKFISPIPSGIL